MHLLSLVLVIADQKNTPFLWKFLKVYKFLRTGPDRWWGTTVCPWSANSRWGKAANHGRFSSIQYAKDLSFEEFLRKFGKVFGQRISKKFEKYSGNICQENPKKSWNSWRKNVEKLDLNQEKIRSNQVKRAWRACLRHWASAYIQTDSILLHDELPPIIKMGENNKQWTPPHLYLMDHISVAESLIRPSQKYQHCLKG